MAPVTIPDKITGQKFTAAELNQILDAIKDGTLDIITSQLTSNGEIISPKTKMTADGGFAVLLTNDTGAASIQGYVVTASASVDNGVSLLGVGIPAPIGVFLDSGVANGAEAWVVVHGIADVYYEGSTSRGDFARMTFATDTNDAAGVAISEAIPSSPFSSDKHFAEIGHVLETRIGAGLAKTMLHYN